jgi:hypothetical protein
MNTNWTNSSTWTFETGEHLKIAEGAITYCDKCVAKYPDAQDELDNLRACAIALLAIDQLNRNNLHSLYHKIMKNRRSERTGHNMLAEYVGKLYARL